MPIFPPGCLDLMPLPYPLQTRSALSCGYSSVLTQSKHHAKSSGTLPDTSRLAEGLASSEFSVLSHSVVSDSSQPHGPQLTRLLCSWDLPGKKTGVGCHFQLQGIFQTQGSNPRLLSLLYWQVDSLPLCLLGKYPQCTSVTDPNVLK